MPEHSYTSRQELDQYSFSPLVTLLAPLACVILQVELPKLWQPLGLLDLPLIVTIFFAVSRRSPIAGALTGTLIGLFQDGLTNHPFGEFGIAKAVIAYTAASIGFAVDVENIVSRALLNLVAYLAQSGLLYLIQRWLLANANVRLVPLRDVVGAVANTVVAIPLFFLLDHFKRRE